MGVRALHHWEDAPSMEPIRRKTDSLRAREDRNPTKFGKAKRSIPRLDRASEVAVTTEERITALGILSKRIGRAYQLSTSRLRIAPGTNELHDKQILSIRTAVQQYKSGRLCGIL